MGRKRECDPIGNNPISRKLAYLLRHPDSGHPDPHSLRGYKLELENIHDKIAELYPGEGKNQISTGTLEMYVKGKRNPQFDSVRKISEALKILYGMEIDPYDFFVNEDKWIDILSLSDRQIHIINMIKNINNENYLEGIEKLCEISLREEGRDRKES